MKSAFVATWILGCGRVHGHLKSDSFLTVTHMQHDKTSQWYTCRSDSAGTCLLLSPLHPSEPLHRTYYGMHDDVNGRDKMPLTK